MWRSAVSWAPALGLVSVVGAHVVGLAWGGLPRVVAWYLGVQVLPVLALLWLVPAIGVLAWRRRVRLPLGLVVALSTACVLVGVVGYGLVPIAYPFTSLGSASPTATVRLPTDAPMVVVWGGDHVAENYHAIDPGQRWAYDFVVEPAGHGGTDLEGYGCYGVPVVAPAAATVTVAVDGRPDHVPGVMDPNPEQATGNHVALRLDTGTHLLIAHLQPGSVQVAAGDEVTEGDVLGRCGNSGHTSEPHVHIHHQRQDPAVLGPLGEGLPLFFRDHGGEPMPTGGVAVDGDVVRLVGARVRHGG